MGLYGLLAAPAFYWEDSAGTTNKLIWDGEAVSDFNPQTEALSDSAAALTGAVYRSTYGCRRRISLTMERFKNSDGSRERKLRAMLAHLDQGGWVAFTHDQQRVWAAASTGPVAVGTSSITTGGNAFTGLEATGMVSNGDHVIIRNPSPYSRWEKLETNAWTGGPPAVNWAPTIPSPRRFSYSTGAVLCWEGFYPRLVLPEGRTTDGALVNSYWNTWDFRIELVEQADLIDAYIAAQE